MIHSLPQYSQNIEVDIVKHNVKFHCPLRQSNKACER